MKKAKFHYSNADTGRIYTGCLITNGSLFQGSTAQPLDHLGEK
jgi:hypothetical protein